MNAIIENLHNHSLIRLNRKQEVLTSDVMLLEADINYTTFNLTSGKKIVVSSTLKTFENLFPKKHFLRLNKSVMLNKEYVKFIDANRITLKNEQVITVSRRRLPYVLANCK